MGNRSIQGIYFLSLSCYVMQLLIINAHMYHSKENGKYNLKTIVLYVDKKRNDFI